MRVVLMLAPSVVTLVARRRWPRTGRAAPVASGALIQWPARPWGKTFPGVRRADFRPIPASLRIARIARIFRAVRRVHTFGRGEHGGFCMDVIVRHLFRA
ncbi:hypothetical protein GCM10027612_21170 [Microbispora bryophytorum subsp. camponoti]